MDFEQRAKAALLKQIRDAGGVQTFTVGETHPVSLRYPDDLARGGLIEEAERTREQVTYRLKEQDT